MPNSAATLPARRVAIVQSESESLHNPSFDVTGVLEDRERWRFRLFTDRTFEALLKAQAEFDCIVIGYNAIHRNEGIAPLLAQATVGVLVLHQLHLPAETMVGSAHGLAVAHLPDERHVLSVPSEREPELEVLLNWPDAVDVAGLQARVVTALAPPPDTPWRPVLEAGEGSPVVIRSSLMHSPPLAACSLLLENGNPAHRALLANLIAFCAGGPPRTIVLGGETSPWAGTLVRKLRLRRVNAIELDPAQAELHYRRWPLRGVSDVIVPLGHQMIPGEDQWLAGGGRLTRVDPATGELHVRYRAPDVRWVARRWASWLQSGAGQARHTSVMANRAYIRTLAALEQEMDGEQWRLGLPDLAHHAGEVRDLINRRLGDRDNLEGTIAASAAVVELDELVPDAMATEPERIERVRDWLRSAAVTAGAQDRLEIARVLRDRDLLRDAAVDLRQPVSAAVDQRQPVSVSALVRLRLAAIACQSTDLVFALDGTDRDAILAEIVTSLLAAADYLSSMAAVRNEPGLANADLAMDDVLLADAAAATLTKLGTIAAPVESPSVTLEEVSAEARALIACAGLDAVPTSELVKIESVPPAQFIEDVLRESLEIRQSNTAQRSEIAALNAASENAQRQLTLARNLLGVAVTTVALLAAVAVVVFLSAQTAGLPEVLAELAAPLTVFIVVLFGLAYPLKRRELSPAWLAKLASALADGAGSLRSTLAEGLGRPTDPEGQK
ncbi:MAG: hypothetical protein QOG59_2020 [Solirubrobacteraceae bacterium]|nr:hypothetical protein [Solirubrobacteraceae bacterium]